MSTRNADAAQSELPGRLGDPTRALKDDPRADPRMIAALVPFGLDGEQAALPVAASSSTAELLAFTQGAEDGFGAVFNALFAELPPVHGVEHHTVQIAGPDGNDIVLFLHRPAGVGTALPAVVHFHGGGGVILRAADTCYIRWRDELAMTGLVVIGVEFRNAGGAHGTHPFPAGLRDCLAAVRWTAAHKDELGVSGIVLSGESGGGNLSLAVALKANQEGWVGEIDGVYALAPMISGSWDKPSELPSQRENDGYFISCDLLSIMGALYDPTGTNAQDPACWPSKASDEELAELPAHVISVNELDPLRDEGLLYQRRLTGNGVSALAHVVSGTVHGGDVFFRGAMPEVYAATIDAIHSFAVKVSSSEQSSRKTDVKW